MRARGLLLEMVGCLLRPIVAYDQWFVTLTDQCWKERSPVGQNYFVAFLCNCEVFTVNHFCGYDEIL